MKKILLSSSFTIAIVLTLVTIIGGQHTQSVLAYGNSISEKMEIFRLILDTVQQRYVEEHSSEELLEYAINGMLSKLDPHTSYMPVDNFKRWNKNFEGFQGIGIHYIFIDKAPTITGFIANSPAKDAGVEIGDQIQEVNGNSAIGLSRFEIANIINNSPYSSLSLRIWRPQERQEHIFKIRRTHLNLKSVQIKTMLQNGIGYINIDRFCSNTAFELDYALESLTRQGMRSLVLDLRDNGGGYLSSAVEVAGRFLPPGKLIVYTMGKDPASYQEYRSSRDSHFSDLPITILINHGTASAAEIVAGALQDWDRALIVGETSFGKGLVQSQYRFKDGSALLVTTAKYYTPLGRLIQRNYYNRTKDQYYYDAYDEEARQPGQNKHEKQTFITERGRKVYGGGGITPDIWIRNKEAAVSDELLDLYLNNNEQVLKFALGLAANRPALKQLPAHKLSKSIILHASEMQKLRSTLAEIDLNYTTAFFNKNEKDIRFLLKREIGYLSQGLLGRFSIAKDRDKQLKIAVASEARAEALVQFQLSHAGKEETE
ncbi:MAG: S41 family peptidase [Calditrichaeota bacterium]|nr:MAG: S41 family peptidase [Calditrichota bacterium]